VAKNGDTETRILDAAQQLVQVRGYNAFSYADVASVVNLRTATLHYYFPTKSDLARELVVRYRAGFQADLKRIERTTRQSIQRLKRYTEIHRNAMGDGSALCLCTMLSADFTTLDESVREQVKLFSQDNERWLKQVLLDGRSSGELSFQDPVEIEARVLFAGVEGAAMVVRCYQDVRLFDPIVKRLLAALGVRMM
jgi:TetR/AcrR family transcriptional regulator, transcriptional repressor for nem operon